MPERAAVDHRDGDAAALVEHRDLRAARERLVGDAEQRAAHLDAAGRPAAVEAGAVPGGHRRAGGRVIASSGEALAAMACAGRLRARRGRGAGRRASARQRAR